MAKGVIRNVPPEDEGAAVHALLEWGGQTIMHAVAIAARETGVTLSEHEHDTEAVQKVENEVNRLKAEALAACGSPIRMADFAYHFTRRVFDHCDQYL